FLDMVFGCIGDLPWLWLIGLMVLGQRPQQAAHPIGIVDHPQSAMHMHHRVIPRGHLTPGLVLGRIPVRTDIAVRAAKNEQYLGAIHPRQFVAPRDVAMQDIADQLERQMIGAQPVRRAGHHDGKRIGTDQPVQHVGTRLVKSLWHVHVSPQCVPINEAITAFCTCRRFSASSMAMQAGESITASVALMFRRKGRQWLNRPWLVNAIFASSTMKCLFASRMGFSSSQRPKNGSAPQLLALTTSAPA